VKALSFLKNAYVLFPIQNAAESTALAQDNFHAYITSNFSNEDRAKKLSIKKHLRGERCLKCIVVDYVLRF